MAKYQNRRRAAEKSGNVIGVGLTALLTSMLTAVGGWIGYSAFGIKHDLPLPEAIGTERENFSSLQTGTLSYYADRAAPGRPLLLLHSINAAASAFEMRPIFEHYRGKRPVYALELPGFGFSERSERVYSPHLYTQAILEMLKQVIGQRADVVSLSLSSEFAARAALQQPSLFNSLAMISPSGFTSRRNQGSSQQANQSGASNFFYNLFSFPLWSQAFYDLLATKRSIHWFLRQSFEGEVHQGLETYSYYVSHQPGARNAPLYFVSGKLFSKHIARDVYERLMIPVMVLYDRDPYVTFDKLPDILMTHGNWQAIRISPTRGLPHFEKPLETFRALDEFWEKNPPGTRERGWIIESGSRSTN